MKKIQYYLLLCLVAFSTGCPNQPSKSFKNKDTFVSNVNEYLAQQQVSYNQVVLSLDSLAPGTPQEVVDAVDRRAQRIRNDAIEDAIAVVDSNYNDFITKINTRRSTTDFLADVIDLGTSAATGIVKGERPNQILGIALTAFRGGRRSAEINFYKEQTTPILIAKMDSNRSKVYGEILQKKAKSVRDYSMKEAIRDMVAYYNAGTLIRAFAELQKQTSVEAEIARLGVLRLQGLNDISRIPTVAEAQVVTDLAAALSGLEADLKVSDKRDAAAVRLKTFYDTVAARTEFAAIITTLKGKASGTIPDDTRTATTKARIKMAFDKLDNNQPLTGEEYLALVNGVLSETEGNADLQKLLLDTFNAM